MYKSNRARTRDLLLEYDVNIMPTNPRAAGLAMVYPWESVGLNMLGDQIYALAANSGYNGSRDEFRHYFGSYLENNRWDVLFEVYENFPATGEQNKLYFDLNEKILYYWTGTTYEPVNAMLIANTILQGGEA